MRFAGNDLIHRLRAGPGNAGTIAYRRSREEARFIEIIVAVAVPNESASRSEKVWSTLKSNLLPVMLRTGLKRKLFATPEPRFGSGNRFSRFCPTGLMRFVGMRLPGNASRVN